MRGDYNMLYFYQKTYALFSKLIVFLFCFNFLIPNVLSAKDNTESILKDISQCDIFSCNYFLGTLKYMKEKEVELTQLNFSIKSDFTGNEAGVNTSSKLNISAYASKGIYPYEVEFETGSSFTFQNKNEESEFSENIISTRINYERYFHPLIEGFAFLERFSDSYLHLDQRYEIGAGTKIEIDLFYNLPSELNKEIRWVSFITLYRNLLSKKLALEIILKEKNLITEQLKQNIIEEANSDFKAQKREFILIYLLQYKERIEKIFEQPLSVDLLLLKNDDESKYYQKKLCPDTFSSQNDNSFESQIWKNFNDEVKKINDKLKGSGFSTENKIKIFNDYEISIIEEDLKTIQDLIEKLEYIGNCFDKIKYSLQKKECPLQLGISSAVFYELEQYQGNFSYRDEKGNLISSSQLLPQEEKIRFSVRPSIIFRISDSLELAGYLYYKGIFHGENLRKSIITESFLNDYRLDFYSYLKVTWPLKDSWAKNISMSVVLDYNYVNIPPYLDYDVMNTFKNKHSNIKYESNILTDYSETKHFSYGLKLEIKF